MGIRALCAIGALVLSVLNVQPFVLPSLQQAEGLERAQGVALSLPGESFSDEAEAEHALSIQASGADPWVIEHDGLIYYLHTTGEDIKLWVAPSLDEIRSSIPVTVWQPSAEFPHASRNIWAPEIHHIDGKWYIYFAADDGNNENHRMFVLESSGGPLGPFEFRGKLAPEGEDFWAIDGTPVLIDGTHYFIWSGWPGPENGRQNLYIAKMKNPWTLEGTRTLIATPTYEWESWINEGPQIVSRNGHTYLVYSANESWTDNYQLGMIRLDGHPLNPAAWKKFSEPVFESVNDAFGPGHCSFLFDERIDGGWIVYHVARGSGAGWDREVRAQRWKWVDNVPHFGTPLPRTPMEILEDGEPLRTLPGQPGSPVQQHLPVT